MKLLGMGATTANELAPIQLLIDETHAGTATIDTADSAQAAVNSLSSGISPNPRPSGITTAAAIIIGLGIGMVITATAFVLLENHGKVAA